MKKIYYVRALYILTNKHFPKTISQQEFGYVLPTELGEVVRDFLPSLLKRKVPNSNVQPSLTKQVFQFEDYLYQP